MNKVKTLNNHLQNMIVKLNSEEKKPVNNYQLFSQNLSNALFYSEYYLHCKEKKYAEKAIDKVEQAISLITEKNINATFSSGIAGVLWLVSHLEKIGILTDTKRELFDEFSFVVDMGIEYSTKTKIYDPLVGLVGYGNCLLEFPKIPEAKKMLRKILDGLDEQAIDMGNNMISFSDNYSMNDDDKVKHNFGLAHGIVGIGMFYIKLIEQSLFIEESKDKLREICNWIINNQYNKHSKYMFPYSLVENQYNVHSLPRLGWCMGRFTH